MGDDKLIDKLSREKKEMYEDMYKLDDKVLAEMTIVIIDDSEESLHLMESFIKKDLPCKVKSYLNEFEALKDISDQAPSLIILDVMLGSLDGMKIGKAVKELHFFDGPIIFVSSNDAFRREAEEIFQKQAQFLSKPLNKGLFIETILKNLASS
jgi:DNA-binding NtrC family response regulator